MTILANSAPNVKRFIEIFKTIFSPSFSQQGLPKALKDKRLHRHGSFKKSVSIPENIIPLLIYIAPNLFSHLPNVTPIEEAIRSLVARWASKLPQQPCFTEVIINIPRLFEPQRAENGKLLKKGKTYSLYPLFVRPYLHHLSILRDAAFLYYAFDKKNISKAAALIGISPRTFQRWLKKADGHLDKLLLEIAKEIFNHRTSIPDFLRGIGSDRRSKLRGLFMAAYIWVFRILDLDELYIEPSQIGLTGIINFFLQEESGIGGFI